MIRLFVEDPLSGGFLLGLDADRSHYLTNVMRLAVGDDILVFNGRDGEWDARLEGCGKGWCSLKVGDKTRDQNIPGDLWLLMAAIKKPRMGFAVEKATELGAGLIWPVITRHTVMAAGTNAEKLALTAIEAAEQCERLDVPTVRNVATLADILAKWPTGRRLVVCAETGNARPATDVFAGWAKEPAQPTAILIGPEGGFAREELEQLQKLPFVTFVGLGPRILRAETAAITALATFQAFCGDFALALPRENMPGLDRG